MGLLREINKKITIYSTKISDSKTLLKVATENNTKLRKEGKSLEERQDIVNDIKVLNTQIMAYTQMRVELEELADAAG